MCLPIRQQLYGLLPGEQSHLAGARGQAWCLQTARQEAAEQLSITHPLPSVKSGITGDDGGRSASGCIPSGASTYGAKMPRIRSGLEITVCVDCRVDPGRSQLKRMQ